MSSHDADVRFSSSAQAELSLDSESVVPTTRYPFIFPKDFDGTKVVIVECDPVKAPYVLDDMLSAIQALPEMKEIRTVGPMALNYVQVIEFASAAAADSFAKRSTVIVKGSPAQLARVSTPETAILLNWIWPSIPDELVVQKFACFGKVRRIIRLKSHRPGCEQIETTSRLVLLERDPTCNLTAIPYVLHIKGFRIAVNIHDRPPICWKCMRIGHFRASCKAVPCDHCHKFTHVSNDCSARPLPTVLHRPSMDPPSAPACSAVSVVPDFPPLPPPSAPAPPPASSSSSPSSPPPDSSWRSRSPVRSPRSHAPVSDFSFGTRRSMRRRGAARSFSVPRSDVCTTDNHPVCESVHAVDDPARGQSCASGNTNSVVPDCATNVSAANEVDRPDVVLQDVPVPVLIRDTDAAAQDDGEYILPVVFHTDSNISLQNAFQVLSEQQVT